jgi:hypothetical protein
MSLDQVAMTLPGALARPVEDILVGSIAHPSSEALLAGQLAHGPKILVLQAAAMTKTSASNPAGCPVDLQRMWLLNLPAGIPVFHAPRWEEIVHQPASWLKTPLEAKRLHLYGERTLRLVAMRDIWLNCFSPASQRSPGASSSAKHLHR